MSDDTQTFTAPDGSTYTVRFITLTGGVHAIDGRSITGLIPNGAIIKPECKHEWKKYEGFSKAYNYCLKCDKKDE